MLWKSHWCTELKRGTGVPVRKLQRYICWCSKIRLKLKRPRSMDFSPAPNVDVQIHPVPTMEIRLLYDDYVPWINEKRRLGARGANVRTGLCIGIGWIHYDPLMFNGTLAKTLCWEYHNISLINPLWEFLFTIQEVFIILYMSWCVFFQHGIILSGRGFFWSTFKSPMVHFQGVRTLRYLPSCLQPSVRWAVAVATPFFYVIIIWGFPEMGVPPQSSILG